MSFISASLLLFCLFSSCCVADAEKKLLDVVLVYDNKHASTLNVVFENKTETPYFLSKYNFCRAGVIFQDLFVVKNSNSEYEDASYGGPVDFVWQGSLKKGQFIEIPPMSSVSCSVDIGFYYLTELGGTFVVNYKSINPGLDEQHSAELLSNKVEITLRRVEGN